MPGLREATLDLKQVETIRALQEPSGRSQPG
jgi:hypothetical protein